MELPVAIKDKIRQELELHFLLTYYVINSELIRLEKEKIELEKNLTLSAKVKNLLDIAKQTQVNLQTMMKLRDQIEDEAKEAGFHDLSREHLEELTRDYIAQDPYYENRILDGGDGVRQARVDLTRAVEQTLKTALYLIGMQAPERM